MDEGSRGRDVALVILVSSLVSRMAGASGQGYWYVQDLEAGVRRAIDAQFRTAANAAEAEASKADALKFLKDVTGRVDLP